MQKFGERRFRITRSPKKKGGYRKETAKVRKGSVLKVTIEDLSGKGDGIAKKNDFVIFVPKAKPGERVWIRITEVKKSNAVGKRLY